LPIYKSGETVWYVGGHVIISLKVGDYIYEDGNIDEKLDDNIKISVSSIINGEKM